MSVRFKFLRAGARSPVTGERWPAEVWLDREHGARGVLVLEPMDLAWWIADELWEVEVDGACVRATNAWRADRGALRRRIAAWDDGAKRAFLERCREVARACPRVSPSTSALVGSLERASEPARAAVAGYVAATLAASLHDDGLAQRRAFEAEREEQSRWLARALDLAR